ncbi:hypothetical protein GCM10009863_16150 [Streptomyces axinellae]|uniref:Uncharacterized protein n=1 Tax=Streptomyces axinellae TaxID=552788 RepID=A0ABN3PXJ0_9ACTN
MITYSTWSPATPARSSAALMANPPKSAPEKDFREPSSRPMGVRAPATITEVVLLDVAVMRGIPFGREVNEGYHSTY